MVGILGSLLLLMAFVACGLALYAFWRAAAERPDTEMWKRVGRGAWYVSGGAAAVAFGLLVFLFWTHQFQYAYPYQHSSRDLPGYFLVSGVWAGQEGSFLLWILMTAAMGAGLIHWGRKRTPGRTLVDRVQFEAPVMAVVALGQLFLLSMVAGIEIGPLTVGSAPFQLLKDKFPDAPMLQVAGFVPADDNGLNDLLQNYWMTIHPPTLFVGFTLMAAPFAFAVAALWKRRYTEWVRPALPWMIAGCAVLMVGIAMGGYWAYVTLSFGGYWAWDPVENSSLVPWLVGVAGLHAMLVQKKSGAGHKSALILSILAFMFVVYSTFLTRSGILGDVSVHSFVDLGLYNQLLLWIGTMGLVGFGLFIARYRELPAPAEGPAPLSRENLIFYGALSLCLTGLVIIVGTSAPILGRLFRDNPSGVPIEFYNEWTLPLAIAIALLAGLGQLFWWKKMRVENVQRVLMRPLALTVLSTAVVVALTPFVRETVRPLGPRPEPEVAQAALLDAGRFFDVYGQSLLLLFLVFAAFFALWGNGAVLWRIARGNLRLAGGSITHVGFALMLLGIFASSVFNDPLTDGSGANLQGSRDNFILQRGQTKAVEGFTFTYADRRLNEQGRAVYALDVTDPAGRAFRAEAVVYENKSRQWIQHPHVEPHLEEDLYLAVYPSAMVDPEGAATQQANPDALELMMERGQTVALGQRFRVTFRDYDLNIDASVVTLPDSTDLAVAAVLDVTDAETGETRTLRPVYVILEDRQQRFVQTRVPDWGLTLTFAGMAVDQGQIRLVAEGVDAPKPDWLVVQAYRKPWINLLWLGTVVLAVGFTFALVRRVRDQRLPRPPAAA